VLSAAGAVFAGKAPNLKRLSKQLRNPSGSEG